MGKIGFIGGSMFFGSGFLSDLKGEVVETPHGKVDVLVGENIVYISRHGKNGNIPPHKVNHLANIAVFKELGVKQVIGLGSVGSLRSKTKPGSVIIPKDYVDFNLISYFDKEKKHIVPGFNNEMRERLVKIAKKSKIPVTDWEIYFQTRGPRFETKAEVGIIKNYAQIVGMAIGSEATLAKELELDYAAICPVNNFANGIMKKEMTLVQIDEQRKKNVEVMIKFIESIIKDYFGEIKEKKEESSGKIQDFIKSIRGG